MTLRWYSSQIYSLGNRAMNLSTETGLITSDHNNNKISTRQSASSTFLSEQISRQLPASSIFFSEQVSTSNQPPAKRTERILLFKKKYCMHLAHNIGHLLKRIMLFLQYTFLPVFSLVQIAEDVHITFF